MKNKNLINKGLRCNAPRNQSIHYTRCNERLVKLYQEGFELQEQYVVTSQLEANSFTVLIFCCCEGTNMLFPR